MISSGTCLGAASEQFMNEEHPNFLDQSRFCQVVIKLCLNNVYVKQNMKINQVLDINIAEKQTKNDHKLHLVSV